MAERDADQQLIVRGYDLDSTPHSVQVKSAGVDALVDFQSAPIQRATDSELAPAEIRNYRFKV